MARVYRLHVTYPEGSFEPEWEPPGWEPDYWVDPDTGAHEPMPFRWPAERLFLSRSAAQRRAVQLRSYGAKVEVEESEPVVWGRILPHPAPGTYGQPTRATP